MTNIPLLFLPGMMCNHILWQYQIEEFGKDREVFVADFSNGSTIEDMASKALEAAPPEFIAVGLSMGGIVAFEMWKQAPKRILGMALMDTNAYADSPARKKVRERQIVEANDGALEQILIEELKPNYLAPIHRNNKKLLDQILDMGSSLGVTVFEQQSVALMHRGDQMSILSKITCPVEVLCGKEDELCPIEYHQTITSRIDGARLTVLPDCGHMSSMEAPAMVNMMLRDLLARVEGGHREAKYA
ncbi:alpha/beta hydrolase [Temperatibacter marinus]|uniref:Alpha/beta hydrolase n=1 Tax=Temperatibacter marinus TaxID=1456591 RepID=A0AA52EIQ1_9PROT|nr:alpha/beta hydrolase [Temperatibacter marinus]WND03029.1 alpha/beta hydrolase [Temperatibacter marinus]